MRQLEFIRAGFNVNLLVADRVEDVLPRLAEAIRAVSEAEKEMAAIGAERM
jgi:hypothetical protein